LVDAFVIRLVLIVGFMAYLAVVYLVLHLLFARFIRTAESRVLWFFSVVTRPLTRPVRPLLASGTPETRVQLLALVLYAAVWIATKVVLAQLRGEPPS
jgi:hypothetical protein